MGAVRGGLPPSVYATWVAIAGFAPKNALVSTRRAVGCWVVATLFGKGIKGALGNKV